MRKILITALAASLVSVALSKPNPQNGGCLGDLPSGASPFYDH
jgi:hypothetical protein